MNYYAKLYNDNSNPDDIKIHISVIEGIYESNFRQKARVVGDVNITDNSFCKYVKQPYDVIRTDGYTITLNKRILNMETNVVSYDETYTLLSHLLATEGYTQERITQISTAINNILNNRSIKTNQHCLRNWITFD